MGIISRVKEIRHNWNLFLNQDNAHARAPYDFGPSHVRRPDRARGRSYNDKSIITGIYGRMSVDASSIDIRHVRTDDKGRYKSDMKSGLQNCLRVEANKDQAARHFLQDAFYTMLDEGVVALVPIDTTLTPIDNGGYDIITMRCARILEWKPDHVLLDVYNDRTGRHEQVWTPKEVVAIAENPFAAVMNEPNSLLQRVIRKLQLLDLSDEESNSGKLDVIIQLPYQIRSESRRNDAENRRSDLEFQMKKSKYGIGYIDGTEKIVQLNRSAENKLLEQIEYLMKLLYGQLGITAGVLDGTADENTMLHYNNRTIEPLVAALVEAMLRRFITKTARTQGQSIDYFRDPFKIMPMGVIAEVADKFTRNEILTSNEIRMLIGFAPREEERADELRNSNMPSDKL